MSRATPDPQKCLIESNGIVAYVSKDFCFGLLLTATIRQIATGASYSCSNKIFNQNPNQNALDYLASGRSFRRIASLEILTKILIKILNNSFRLQNYYFCVILQITFSKKMQKSSKIKQNQDTSKNFSLRFAHLTKFFVSLFRKGTLVL